MEKMTMKMLAPIEHLALAVMLVSSIAFALWLST
jgi:hypothetical protein